MGESLCLQMRETALQEPAAVEGRYDDVDGELWAIPVFSAQASTVTSRPDRAFTSNLTDE
jgi:hypothetical protein